MLGTPSSGLVVKAMAQSLPTVWDYSHQALASGRFIGERFDKAFVFRTLSLCERTSHLDKSQQRPILLHRRNVLSAQNLGMNPLLAASVLFE